MSLQISLQLSIAQLHIGQGNSKEAHSALDSASLLLKDADKQAGQGAAYFRLQFEVLKACLLTSEGEFEALIRGNALLLVKAFMLSCGGIGPGKKNLCKCAWEMLWFKPPPFLRLRAASEAQALRQQISLRKPWKTYAAKNHVQEPQVSIPTPVLEPM